MAAASFVDRPSVTVVLPTRNRPDALQEAIDCILPLLGSQDRLLVVDSASDDPRVVDVATEAGVHVVRADWPGVSRARNVGARAATTPVVAFTDDDCRPTRGWVDAFADAFAAHDVGFATGTVAGGTAADVVWADARRWQWPPPSNDLGSGASMALRRDALLAAGGFDEDMGPGSDGPKAGEDQELFLRTLREGWAGVFVPQAEVVHHDQRSRLEVLRLFFVYGTGAGAIAAMVRHDDAVLARRILRQRLWTQGLRAFATQLRQAHEFPAACSLTMAAGTVVGRIRFHDLCWRPFSPRPTVP